MARITNFLAGALALGSAVNAKIFDARMSNDLIPLNPIRGAGHHITTRSEKPTVLKPLRPSSSKTKREELNAFNVQHEDYLYWAGNDGTVAELKVEMPGDKEGFVNAEYFSDVVESIDCPKNGTGPISIHFADKLNLDSASDVWKWVNQKEDHEFTFMVGDGDCGWNEDRMVYKITDIEFDDPTNTAFLMGKSTTWNKALHTFEMNIGKDAMQNAQSMQAKAKRGFFDKITDALAINYNPDVSIPFDHSIEKKALQFSMNGVDTAVTCNNCSTAGTFNIEGKFKVKLFDLQEAALVLSTEGIDAIADMTLEIKGELTDALLTKSWPVVKVSPGGISIPNILTIGPTVSINIEAGVKAIKGGAKISLGGVASIPKSSATLDFLAEDKMPSEGWGVELDSNPMKADLVVESKASVALTAGVGLEVSALETGFAAELAAELPSLNAQLKGIESMTCTACSNYETGIEGSISLSTTLSVVMKKKVSGSYNKLWTLSLIDKALPTLASFCQGIGPENCANNATELASS